MPYLSITSTKILSAIAVVLLVTPLWLRGQSLADTVKVRAYSKQIVARNYWSTYPDSIQFYAKKGISLAEQIGDQYGMADMYKHLGVYYYSKADYENTLFYYRKSETIFRQLGMMGDVARMQVNTGMIFNRLGAYGEGAKLLFESIKLLEQMPRQDTLLIASTYISLGLIQKNLKQYSEARDTYKHARRLLQNSKDQRARQELAGGVYVNMGNLLRTLGQYDSAKLYHLNALRLFDDLDNMRGKVTCYNNLANVDISQGLYQEAFQYAKQGYNIAAERGFVESQISSLIAMADARFRMMDYKSSLLFLHEAQKIAVRGKSRVNELAIYKGLADANRELKNYVEAIAFLEKYAATKDSLFNLQSAAQVSALRFQYDFEKKDQEIRVLEKEKHFGIVIRNIFIALTIAVLVIAALIVTNLRQRSKKDRVFMLEKEARLRIQFQKELTQSQIKALQSQMNPHFIFNCLNSIDYFIQQSRPGQASDYLAKFAKLIRLFMESVSVEYNTIDKELQTLDLYLQLEKLRFGNRLSYEIVTSEIDTQAILIPSMVIQPFVENAIIHGIQPLHDKAGRVTLTFRGASGAVVCSIEDNGVGRGRSAAPTAGKRKSFGMTLSKERLRLLQPDSKLEIIDLYDEQGRARGTRVEISFALVTEERQLMEQVAIA